MMTAELPRDCLSDLALDDILAGVRPSDPHLDGCARCTERLGVLRESNEASEAVVRVLAQRVPKRTSSRRRWWLGLAAAGALTAGLVPLLFAPPPTTTFKGSAVQFFVQRDGVVTRGVSGASYRAGDRLRFSVTSERGEWLLIAGVETTGKVSIYHPFGGPRSAPHQPGTDVRLPHSLVLDDSLATEFFVVTLSAQPVSARAVREAVAAVDEINEHTLTAQTLRQLGVPGDVHVLVVRKE